MLEKPPGITPGDVVSAPGLAHVIGDSPAAVLMVDLRGAQVVHANDVALQLAPGVSLPVSLDVWSDAARLRDPDGNELTGSSHPLSRLGRREVVPGQPVSAARASELGESREPLWVVGVPMQGATAFEDFAIVLLLSIRHEGTTASDHVLEGDGADSLLGLAEAARAEADDSAADKLHRRAVLATGLAFTVADATDPEFPLVWVNPAFTATTGFSFEESVGRNCRFLQGPATSQASVSRMRDALRDDKTITETVLNYRKDGLAFWNSVTLSPIRDASGRVTHSVGVQVDVSAQVEADRLRDLALLAARRSRDEAQLSQARLQLLAEAAERLSGELDADECRRRLLDVVVPRLADMAAVFHVDDDGEVIDWETRHRDPSLAEAAEAVIAALPDALYPGGPIHAILGTDQTRLLSDMQSEQGHKIRESLIDDDPAYVAQAEALGIDSSIVAAMPGRRRARDLMVLSRAKGRPGFDEADVALAADLGRRAGVLLDSARLYQRQHHIATTLQRSLLPQVSGLDLAEISARYLPGATGAEVGGDFYDITELADGTLSMVVGDVLGHDVMAAAAMGHLKGMLWALAHELSSGPAQVLERVDALLGDDAPLTSVLLVRMTRVGDVADGDGEWEIRSSSAGHPPFAVRRPDGSVELVETRVGAGRETLLGLGPVERTEHTFRVPAGSTLVAFTDGLVERAGQVIDVGLRRLRDELGRGPRATMELCDHLLDQLAPHDELAHPAHRDDVALLVARLR